MNIFVYKTYVCILCYVLWIIYLREDAPILRKIYYSAKLL